MGVWAECSYTEQPVSLSTSPFTDLPTALTSVLVLAANSLGICSKDKGKQRGHSGGADMWPAAVGWVASSGP